MKWTSQAEEAISKVPFFVRRRVRKRVEEEGRGYRILVGGKLGRHPKLGRELGGVYSMGKALGIIDRCLDHYQRHCLAGERLGEVLERTGLKGLRKAIDAQI